MIYFVWDTLNAERDDAKRIEAADFPAAALAYAEDDRDGYTDGLYHECAQPIAVQREADGATVTFDVEAELTPVFRARKLGGSVNRDSRCDGAPAETIGGESCPPAKVFEGATRFSASPKVVVASLGTEVRAGTQNLEGFPERALPSSPDRLVDLERVGVVVRGHGHIESVSAQVDAHLGLPVRADLVGESSCELLDEVEERNVLVSVEEGHPRRLP